MAHKVLWVLASPACLSNWSHIPPLQPHLRRLLLHTFFSLPGRVSLQLKSHFLGKLYSILESRLGFLMNP